MVKKRAEGADFSKEIAIQRKLWNESQEYIAEGILAYERMDYRRGRESFSKIKLGNPYFAIMNKIWYEWAIENNNPIDTDALTPLAINRYETYLRANIKELEWGCIRGLEDYYGKIIKNKPVKLRSFNTWKISMREKFDKLQPYNWYMYYGENHINSQVLAEVNLRVEDVVLNYKKSESFYSDWTKINKVRVNLYENLSYLQWNGGVHPESLDGIMEEIRSNILLGNYQESLLALKVVDSLLLKIFKNIDENQINGQASLLFFSRNRYLKGLNLYLKGENKYLLGQDAFDITVGRTGAAVQLYLCGLKYGKTKWSLKAKKLYKKIQKETLDRYGRQMKDYPEFKNLNEKAPVKK